MIKINNFYEKIYLRLGLYDPINLQEESEQLEINALNYFDLHAIPEHQFDAFCIYCNKESTFKFRKDIHDFKNYNDRKIFLNW